MEYILEFLSELPTIVFFMVLIVCFAPIFFIAIIVWCWIEDFIFWIRHFGDEDVSDS